MYIIKSSQKKIQTKSGWNKVTNKKIKTIPHAVFPSLYFVSSIN